MILDALFADVRQLAQQWEDLARDRRRLTATDPAADTLVHCATTLRQRVHEVDTATGYVTPAQFGALQVPAVKPHTVVTWIRKGWLAALKTEAGYAIRRDAKVRRPEPAHG